MCTLRASPICVKKCITTRLDNVVVVFFLTVFSPVHPRMCWVFFLLYRAGDDHDREVWLRKTHIPRARNFFIGLPTKAVEGSPTREASMNALGERERERGRGRGTSLHFLNIRFN